MVATIRVLREIAQGTIEIVTIVIEKVTLPGIVQNRGGAIMAPGAQGTEVMEVLGEIMDMLGDTTMDSEEEVEGIKAIKGEEEIMGGIIQTQIEILSHLTLTRFLMKLCMLSQDEFLIYPFLISAIDPEVEIIDHIRAHPHAPAAIAVDGLIQVREINRVPQVDKGYTEHTMQKTRCPPRRNRPWATSSHVIITGKWPFIFSC
jgi:hypothetical protein